MSYSQDGQDMWLSSWFSSHPPKTTRFIDIGAHDGVKYSNSLLFEEAGWDGVCVEPMPKSFAKLKESRKAKCINAAVSHAAGTVEMHFVNNGESDWLMASSLDVTQRNRWPEQKWETMIVPSVTFDEIIPPEWNEFSLLLIDCEKFDFEILKMFPFDRFQPEMIVAEVGDFPMETFMDGVGYKVARNGGLDLFFELRK